MSLRHGRQSGQYGTPTEIFMDGCHRYGWIISPFITAMISLLMFSYYTGQVNSNIEALQKDVLLLKQQVFELAHVTRGLNEDALK